MFSSPQGFEKNGALCYPLCKSGFYVSAVLLLLLLVVPRLDTSIVFLHNQTCSRADLFTRPCGAAPLTRMCVPGCIVIVRRVLAQVRPACGSWCFDCTAVAGVPNFCVCSLGTVDSHAALGARLLPLAGACNFLWRLFIVGRLVPRLISASVVACRVPTSIHNGTVNSTQCAGRWYVLFSAAFDTCFDADLACLCGGGTRRGDPVCCALFRVHC